MMQREPQNLGPRKAVLISKNKDPQVVLSCVQKELECVLTNGRGGIEVTIGLIREQSAKVVILDIPDPAERLELLESIRKHFRPCALPVLFVIPRDHDHQLDMITELRGCDFTFRPVEPQAMRARLRLLLKNQASLSELRRVSAKLSDRTHELEGINASLRKEIDLRLETEAQLNEARLQAEASDYAKTQFLASISHELRTPLNGIIGFVEIMQQGLFGEIQPSRYRVFVDDIHKCSSHLLEIINDVIEAARMKTRKVTPHEVVTDLNEILDDCGRALAMTAQEKGVIFTVADVTEIPPIHIDPRLIKQAILNLANNAIKFTEPGGEVSLDAALDADGGLAISVMDTGRGIPPEKLGHVVEPFYQVANTYTAGESAGLGLGLAIVNEIMEVHGGRMAILSEEGEGTAVHLIFPRKRVLNKHLEEAKQIDDADDEQIWAS